MWLTALIAIKDPRRRSRVCARWLLRLLEEHPLATIEEIALAASALTAVGGPGHDDAAAALIAITERVISQPLHLRVDTVHALSVGQRAVWKVGCPAMRC